MTALTCMVCGSLSSSSQSDTCTACVKTYGYNSGCATCAGAALYGIANTSKPTDKGLAVAGGCFDCYAKSGPALQVSASAHGGWWLTLSKLMLQAAMVR